MHRYQMEEVLYGPCLINSDVHFPVSSTNYAKVFFFFFSSFLAFSPKLVEAEVFLLFVCLFHFFFLSFFFFFVFFAFLGFFSLVLLISVLGF